MPLRSVYFSSAADLANFANSAQKVNGATVVAAGSGYQVGDILDVIGGCCEAATQLKVAAAPGGGITSVTIETEGAYTIAPINPVSVAGGNGVGATFNLSLISATSASDIMDILTKDGQWYLEYWA